MGGLTCSKKAKKGGDEDFRLRMGGRKEWGEGKNGGDGLRMGGLGLFLLSVFYTPFWNLLSVITLYFNAYKKIRARIELYTCL